MSGIAILLSGKDKEESALCIIRGDLSKQQIQEFKDAICKDRTFTLPKDLVITFIECGQEIK